MKYIFLTNIVSPHQLPWCREFVKLAGETNFLYLAFEKMHSQRVDLGWGDDSESWIQVLEENPESEKLCSNWKLVMFFSVPCANLICFRGVQQGV
jgi:hypothetical protein